MTNDQQANTKWFEEDIKKINKRMENFTLALDYKVDNAKFLSEMNSKIDW